MESKKTITGESLKAFLRQSKYLEKLDPNTDDYEKAFKTMNAMGTLAIEAAKAESEITKERNDIDRAWTELENKKAADEIQNKEKRIDNIVRYGLELFSIGAPLVFYGIWMKKGFKFEETGTFTSNTFRGLFNRFRPTK